MGVNNYSMSTAPPLGQPPPQMSMNSGPAMPQVIERYKTIFLMNHTVGSVDASWKLFGLSASSANEHEWTTGWPSIRP